jgi:hypothetical protein
MDPRLSMAIAAALNSRPSSANLDLLRKENARLEKQISQFAFVRLALLVLIIILFATAAGRHSNDAAQISLDKITALFKELKTEHPPAVDPIALYLSTPIEPDARVNELISQLKGQYTQLFTVSFSVLGTSISVDLRLIILSAPVWVAIGYMYLAVIREKRRIVVFLGNALNRMQDPERVAVLDRLTFGSREGPYSRYPGVLIEWTFWLGVAILAGLMIKVGGVGDTSDESYNLGSILLVSIFTFSFYTGLLTSRLIGGFQREIEEELAATVPPPAFSQLMDRTLARLRALVARPGYALTLRLGALFVLLSLASPTAVVGCGHTYPKPSAFAVRWSIGGKDYRPGYQLLVRHADWPDDEFPINAFGARYYYVLVSLAVAAWVLSFFNHALLRRLRWALVSLKYLSFASGIFALLDFGLIFFFAPLMIEGMLNLPNNSWVLPSLLVTQLALFATTLFACTSLGKGRVKRVRERLGKILFLFYVPVVFSNLVYVGNLIFQGFPGMMFVYLGAQVLTIGFLRMHFALDSEFGPGWKQPEYQEYDLALGKG